MDNIIFWFDIIKYKYLKIKLRMSNIDFYYEIKCDEWLSFKGKQEIRFSDRIERRRNKKLHSVSKPAIEYFDGLELYFLNGKKYSKEEWIEKIENAKNEKRK
jgi:hypothetical protein